MNACQFLCTCPSCSPHPYPLLLSCSNGRPQTWTQKGEWVKDMFEIDRPFLHLQRRSKLFSKFHGPSLSTHSSWYSEPNLNWNMFFPTSTILSSDPIFHIDLRLLLRARWFWCLFARSRPKRLRECLLLPDPYVRKNRQCPRAFLGMTLHEVQGEGRLELGREGETPTKGELS